MSRDPLLDVMRSGAGLPVLSVLDEYLSDRADGDEAATLRSRTLTNVLAETRAWLEKARTGLAERLAACDDGPLPAVMHDHLEQAVEARARALTGIDRRAGEGGEEAAWALLEAELLRLHTLRAELQQIHRAADHLEEVADVVQDIPRDEVGLAALEELSRLEALAASAATPTQWLQAAKRMEDHCLDHVRFPAEEPEAPVPEATPEPVTAEPAPASTSSNNGHAKSVATGSRESPTGRSPQPRAAARLVPPTTAPRASASPLQRFLANHHRPTTDHQGQAMAGPEVLADWRGRTNELARQGVVPEGLRHGVLWTPILEGEVAAPTGTVDELLEVAMDVEIDLVEIELPRILALPTGGGPAAVQDALAECAKRITLQDPKQSAREVLLDYVVGKLPLRYRATPEGLALVESIAHALARDEPWEAKDHDYGRIVQNLVERELARTPAVELTDLARSLVGHRPEALEVVARAAEAVAESDPRVQLHEDGILVRALADREDPDKLYKLRGALEARLGHERASQLIKTLVTAGGDDHE